MYFSVNIKQSPKKKATKQNKTKQTETLTKSITVWFQQVILTKFDWA